MEGSPSLIFKYKCRRNMFVARPAVCRPAVQGANAIVALQHRSDEDKTTTKPHKVVSTFFRKFIRSRSLTKTEVIKTKSNNVKEEEEGTTTASKEVTLEFKRSFSSSLHLNVSPCSSITFDRRDATSRMELLTVTHCGENLKQSEQPPLISSKIQELQEDYEENSAPSTSSRISNELSSRSPLWKYLTYPQGDFILNERPGRFGDSKSSEDVFERPILGPASISGDDRSKLHPLEVNITSGSGPPISCQKVMVRQLPLRYSMSDESLKTPPLSRGIQCSGLTEVEESGDNLPPPRDTMPDSPYVRSYKCTCHLHAPSKKNDRQMWNQSISTSEEIAQTKPPAQDKSTQFEEYIPRQTDPNPLQSYPRRPLRVHASIWNDCEFWDTATISDDSQVNSDPIAWYFKELHLQRQESRSSSCSRHHKCRTAKHESHRQICTCNHQNYNRLQRTFSVSTQTPRHRSSPCSVGKAAHRKRDLERIGTNKRNARSVPGGLTNTTPRLRGRSTFQSSPQPKRVIKRQNQPSRSVKYQMHTFSSIQKRCNNPQSYPCPKRNTWR